MISRHLGSTPTNTRSAGHYAVKVFRTPRRTLLLQKRHVNARLKYVNDHLNKPAAFWILVLWSDETKIELFGETAQTMFEGNKTKSINQSAPYPLLRLEVAQSWCGDVSAHQRCRNY
ncbi:hypothetical protein FHG87_018974 [Trinorchestia longiramus]|nr:hypothetical protein FHG87_018974 [Trinorchestia longiramus]